MPLMTWAPKRETSVRMPSAWRVSAQADQHIGAEPGWPALVFPVDPDDPAAEGRQGQPQQH